MDVGHAAVRGTKGPFENGPQGELQVYFEHDERTKERAG